MPRNIEFDREEVIQNAMSTFWKNGYTNTSIPDLVTATKLNPGSIYSAFRSKEGLFLETLEHYGTSSLTTLKQIIATAASPLQGIEQFFAVLICTEDETHCQGCLVVNTLLEMTSHSPNIQEKANQQLLSIETELLKTLEAAKESGEIPKNADSEALAKFLMINIWGLRVMAKSGYLKGDDIQVSKAKMLVDKVLSSLKH